MNYPAPDTDQASSLIEDIVKQFYRYNQPHCISISCFYECGHTHRHVEYHSCLEPNMPSFTEPPCIKLDSKTARLTTKCEGCWQAAMAPQALGDDSGERPFEKQHQNLLNSRADPASLTTVASMLPADVANPATNQELSPSESRPTTSTSTSGINGSKRATPSEHVCHQSKSKKSRLLSPKARAYSDPPEQPSSLRQVGSIPSESTLTAVDILSDVNHIRPELSPVFPPETTTAVNTFFTLPDRTVTAADMRVRAHAHDSMSVRYASWPMEPEVSLSYLRSFADREQHDDGDDDATLVGNDDEDKHDSATVDGNDDDASIADE